MKTSRFPKKWLAATLGFAALTAGAATAAAPDIAAALSAMPKRHPRLLVRGQADFDAINARAKADPLMGEFREIVLATAEVCRTNPPVRGMSGMRMTGQDSFSASAVTLAMAYRLTGDRRFGEAVRDQMLAVSDWVDWNPSHYLDVAEMLMGMSIGYDWAYDILTDDERTKIRRAMIEKGFNTRNVKGWWKKAANNWPQVCWGMIGLTAVSIGTEEPETAATMLNEILASLHPCLAVYAPHGAYPEGPGYWGYGTGYFLYMIAAFDAAFGTDFGLFDKPGIAETDLFINAMTGPSGRFWNFSDGHWKRNVRVCDAYLAKKTGRRGILAFDIDNIRRFLTDSAKSKMADRVKGIRKVVEMSPFWLLWGDFGEVSAADSDSLDYVSGGRNPVVILRSSRNPDAAYFGLKGGKSCYNHGHMDQGSILWESDGWRWAMDIGPQNYTELEQTGINLWNVSQTGDRWRIFRMNNLSHNLVTVDERLFCVTGFCDFVSTHFDSKVASATLDLSPAVSPYASRGARRCTLDRKTRIGIVEDGLEGLRPGAAVRWALVSEAPYARIRENDLVLQNFRDDSLILRRETPETASWNAVDMSFRPNPWDRRNDGWVQCSFTVSASEDGKYKSRVLLIPGPKNAILANEDVRLEAVLGSDSDFFDRMYKLRYGTNIPEKIAEAQSNAVRRILFTGNLRNLTWAGVQKLKAAGPKVYLSGRVGEALRYAALVGADGVVAERKESLEEAASRIGARSVTFNFITPKTPKKGDK